MGGKVQDGGLGWVEKHWIVGQFINEARTKSRYFCSYHTGVLPRTGKLTAVVIFALSK